MADAPLQGKRILMFSTHFFGYCDTITQQLRQMGATVVLYDERPSNDVLTKLFIRKSIGIIAPRVQRYFSHIVEENAGKDFDYIFVIRGEAISPAILDQLKAAFPRAKCILYLWDAVENIPNCERKLSCYDRVLTFDARDAQTYHLLFRPLFYCGDFEATGTQPQEGFRYDVAFVGTAHSVRPKVVKAVQEQCRREGRTAYVYFFLPHPLVFVYNKLLNPCYRGVKYRDIHFQSLSFQEINDIYRDSRCVLDIEHVKQRGITMRTIELLGLHKKIITTNQSVLQCDFYDPHDICVIDRDNPKIDSSFWDAEYRSIPQHILKRYSLQAFLQEIFDVGGDSL